MEQEETPPQATKKLSNKRTLEDVTNTGPIPKKKLFSDENEKESQQLDTCEKVDSNITSLFFKGCPLLPEELLIYACLKILFPEAPFRSYSEEKYGLITALVQKIFNIELKNKDVYNYVYRSKNNMVKNLGKTDRGRLRWKVFDENVDRLLLKHGDMILALLLQEDSTLDPEMKSTMAEAITSECKNQQRDEKLNLEGLEKFDLSEKFPGWNYAYDHQKCNGYLYYYVSEGHPQIEIMISKEHAWTMYLKGRSVM